MPCPFCIHSECNLARIAHHGMRCTAFYRTFFSLSEVSQGISVRGHQMRGALFVQSQGWVRKSHGTGMGHSSSAGFWIPKQPLAVAPQPRAVAAPRKRKSTGAGFGRGRPSGSGRGRPSKPVQPQLEIAEVIGDSEPVAEARSGSVPVSHYRPLIHIQYPCLQLGRLA